MLPALLNLLLIVILWTQYGMGAGMLASLLAVSVALHIAYLADKGNRDLERMRRQAENPYWGD